MNATEQPETARYTRAPVERTPAVHAHALVAVERIETPTYVASLALLETPPIVRETDAGRTPSPAWIVTITTERAATPFAMPPLTAFFLVELSATTAENASATLAALARAYAAGETRP